MRMLVLQQKVDNGDRQTNSHAKKHSESERNVQVVHRIKALHSKIGHQIVGAVHRPVAIQHCKHSTDRRGGESKARASGGGQRR